MSKTYSKGTCPHCQREVSMAGGAYWRHVEKCRIGPVKKRKAQPNKEASSDDE